MVTAADKVGDGTRRLTELQNITLAKAAAAGDGQSVFESKPAERQLSN